MAKRTSRRSGKSPTRKQLARRDRDKRARQRLLAGTGIVLGLVVLVLAWGLYDQYIVRPGKPVVTVAGEPVPLGTYQKLVAYRRWDYGNYLSRLEAQKQQLAASEQDQGFLLQYVEQQIRQGQTTLMNLPMAVLDELIDDLLARQECAARGISVSPDEVQLHLESQFGYDRNPPTPTPTPITATVPITGTPIPTVAPMTVEQFQERSSNWFQLAQEQVGFTKDDFLRLLESELYQQKLEDVVRAKVPNTAEQIRARHILVESREEAEDILTRLGQGEDFEELAAELSTDASNKDEGGDLGWFSRGRMVPEFDEIAFGLEPGELSSVVESQFGFHVIRVDEKDASRQLEETDLAFAQQTAIDNWFAERRQSPEIVRSWDSTMVPTEVPASGDRRR